MKRENRQALNGRHNEGAEMPQSLANLFIHLVFSTKDRHPWITAALEPDLHAYMAAIFNEKGCHAILINGTNDHIHTLFNLSRTDTVAEIVGVVKSNSSKWIKTQSNAMNGFAWQSGYGAFSIGQSDLERVRNYISNQRHIMASIRFKKNTERC